MTVADKARTLLDLNSLALPMRPKVANIAVEDYVDSTGDDALRVDVLVEDMDCNEFVATEPWKIKQVIRERLLNNGIAEFPYIFLAMPHELAEITEED